MHLNDLQTLSERAKELECVYAVENVLQNRALSLPDMMEELTRIVPAGFSSPLAARVRITLWAGCYETPGFAGAAPLYSAAIFAEEEEVGAVSVAYRTELLETGCPLLQYEIKLLETIASRISQLALGRRRELTLLVNLLLQLDPDMLFTISEKLGVYLEHNFGTKGVLAPLAAFPSYGESNAPTPAAAPINTEKLARTLVEAGLSYLSQEALFTLFRQWIHEQRVLALVKIVDRKDSRIADILDALRKYRTALPAGGGENTLTQTETWLLSELTHRFLSEDERLINLVLSDMRIADFEPMVERIIGSERSMGNIGGKGAGLFIASQILSHAAKEDALLAGIKTPRTWYVATDQMIDFLRFNRLEELNSYKYNSGLYHRTTYENVVAKIKNAHLPPQTVNMLRLVLDDLSDVPLIVRSSSLLEDKHNGTFSGKYKSLFVSNRGTRTERLSALTNALLEVYASMYNPDSLQYRKERGLLNFTEQMGVLIQEVVGTPINDYYMPMCAGVAFSRNLLRWSPRIRPEDGLIRLVMGLGTRAVDRVTGDYPVMLAPGQPALRINQSPDEIRRYSPRFIDLVHREKGFQTVEAAPFFKENGKNIPLLHQYVSVFQNDFPETKNAFSLNPQTDDLAVTFHHALSPSSDFVPKIRRMLEVLSKKLECPVDIEFAYDGQHLYLLQCRPQGVGLMKSPAPIPQNLPRQEVLFTANRYVPDGIVAPLTHLVYVDPQAYSALSDMPSLLAVGEAVGRLNEALPRKGFALLGPGRWGSRGDIKLGVRVTYADIANAALLIEIAKEKLSYVPELSFGTHFFQDLVEGDIVYLPLYPGQKDVIFKESFFHTAQNQLSSILPGFAHLSSVIKVIDIPAAMHGQTLSVHMNSQLEQAVAFFTGSARKPAALPEPLAVLGTQEEHWQWRHYMAEQIAAAIDMEAYAVQGIYLFGSTNTGKTGMGSDIDILLHTNATENQLAPLLTWLKGWGRALARMNYLQTGHDAENLLDVHVVTDADIASQDLFAAKIHSVTDPATPLRLAQNAKKGASLG